MRIGGYLLFLLCWWKPVNAQPETFNRFNSRSKLKTSFSHLPQLFADCYIWLSSGEDSSFFKTKNFATSKLMRSKLIEQLVLPLLLTFFVFNNVYALKRSPQRIPVQRFRTNRDKFDSQLAPRTYPSLNMTPALKLVSMFLIGVASATVYWNNGRQFETVDNIPSQYFKEKQTIKGSVIRVTDGDTFRLRHVPGVWAQSDFKGSLREHTLAVRIYAVDAPETAKNGNPGQPFGKEAAKFVQDKLMNKEVSLKLLAKDQYGRALATVTYEEDGAMFMKGKRADISEELVKRGLAVVYRAGGAQYGGSIDKWNRLENAAKKQKVGIWSLSGKDLETPAEYKRRAAALEKKDKDNGVLKPSKRGIRRYQEVGASQ